MRVCVPTRSVLDKRERVKSTVAPREPDITSYLGAPNSAAEEEGKKRRRVFPKNPPHHHRSSESACEREAAKKESK